MTRRFLATAAFAALFLAGCASSSNVPVSPAPGEAGGQALVAGTPLPDGVKIVNEQSLILGGGADWTGRLTLQAPQPAGDLYAYFRDQYPAAGWTLVSAVLSERSILVLSRGERTATVEIGKSGGFSGGTTVILTVAPKAHSGPATMPGRAPATTSGSR